MLTGSRPPESLPGHRLVPPNARQKLAAALDAPETMQNNKKEQEKKTEQRPLQKRELAHKEKKSCKGQGGNQAGSCTCVYPGQSATLVAQNSLMRTEQKLTS